MEVGNANPVAALFMQSLSHAQAFVFAYEIGYLPVTYT
jgi:hypothetical protein